MRPLPWLLLSFVACNGDKGPDAAHSASETDTDTDADADTDTDADTDSDADADTDTDPTALTGESAATAHTGDPLACVDFDVTVAPALVTGDTTGLPSTFTGTCPGAPNTAGEQVVRFVAPAAGRYAFDLAGTPFDAVVSLLDACGGAPLSCEDTWPAAERVSVDLAAGEALFLVVDGYGADAGPWTMAVASVATTEASCADDLDDDADGVADCADADCAADAACLPSACPDEVLVPGAPATGDTTGGHRASSAPSQCGLTTAGDRSFAFTAPTSGSWVFTAEGTAYDVILRLLDGCGGAELRCSTDDGFGPPVIEYALSAGDTVVLELDGIQEGPYQLLALERLPTELCGNSLDDDLDGAADCADPDCSAEPACVEDCGNGADDDGDYAADCADLDCGLHPACPEDCTNSVDDDGDLQVDCLDVACDLDAACPDTCPDLALTTLPATFVVDPGTSRDVFSPTCGFYRASDVTFEFTAPAAGTYAFDTAGSEAAAVVWVTDGCGGAELACQRYDVNAQVALSASQTVVVGVERLVPELVGTIELHAVQVQPFEVGCADGYDDDADGSVDCVDPDCGGQPECMEDCANLVDDDVDGATDCLDPDCGLEPACAPTCPTAALTGVGRWDGDTRGLPSGGGLYCGSFDPSGATLELTADVDGRYAFVVDPAATGFDAVLGTLTQCGGDLLACDYTLAGLGVDLLAGDTVVATISPLYDRNGGPFGVDVVLAPTAEAACDDGDDDFDGLADCLDPDCAGASSCVEDCRNGVDDDGDDRPDCADLDCADDGACAEQCTNGVDDDGDGRPDCWDAGCADDPACADPCPAYTSTGGLVFGVPGLDNDHHPSCLDLFGDGLDTTVTFTAPSDGTWQFTVAQGNQGISLYDSCGGAELTCGYLGSVAWTLTAGQTVIVVLDEVNLPDPTFALDVRPASATETACADGVDEDGDGGGDCGDPDCATDPACTGTCPDLSLPGAVPSATLGLTGYAPNSVALSCDFQPNAADRTHRFVAPAAGTYTFDTAGSEYLTALAVLDSCGGAELACADEDGGAGAEEVTVALSAGQEVIVVVSGDPTARGRYQLNVR